MTFDLEVFEDVDDDIWILFLLVYNFLSLVLHSKEKRLIADVGICMY